MLSLTLALSGENRTALSTPCLINIWSVLPPRCDSHHQAYLLPGGQPLQKFTSQLEAQNAWLTQAALQRLLILLACVWAPPWSLENIVDNAHDILS